MHSTVWLPVLMEVLSGENEWRTWSRQWSFWFKNMDMDQTTFYSKCWLTKVITWGSNTSYLLHNRSHKHTAYQKCLRSAPSTSSGKTEKAQLFLVRRHLLTHLLGLQHCWFNDKLTDFEHHHGRRYFSCFSGGWWYNFQNVLSVLRCVLTCLCACIGGDTADDSVLATGSKGEL